MIFHACATLECRTMYMTFEDMADCLWYAEGIIRDGGSVLIGSTDEWTNPFITEIKKTKEE